MFEESANLFVHFSHTGQNTSHTLQHSRVGLLQNKTLCIFGVHNCILKSGCPRDNHFLKRFLRPRKVTSFCSKDSRPIKDSEGGTAILECCVRSRHVLSLRISPRITVVKYTDVPWVWQEHVDITYVLSIALGALHATSGLENKLRIHHVNQICHMIFALEYSVERLLFILLTGFEYDSLSVTRSLGLTVRGSYKECNQDLCCLGDSTC